MATIFGWWKAINHNFCRTYTIGSTQASPCCQGLVVRPKTSAQQPPWAQGMDISKSAPWPQVANSTISWIGLSCGKSSNGNVLWQSWNQTNYWKCYALGIENGLHYRWDVTLYEDQLSFIKDSTAHIMSIINNIVLALIAKAGYTYVPSARCYFAANLEEAFGLLT